MHFVKFVKFTIATRDTMTTIVSKHVLPHIHMMWRYLRVGLAVLILTILITSLVAVWRAVALDYQKSAFIVLFVSIITAFSWLLVSRPAQDKSPFGNSLSAEDKSPFGNSLSAEESLRLRNFLDDARLLSLVHEQHKRENTHRTVILTVAILTILAGLGAIILSFFVDASNFYKLYVSLAPGVVGVLAYHLGKGKAEDHRKHLSDDVSG
jgi:hypothetical protein